MLALLRHMRTPALVLTLLALPLFAAADPNPEGETSPETAGKAVIHDGSKVTIEYTLKLDDGEVVDTSEGGAPFVYQHGASQILPALETQLEGMAVGSEKEVTLTAEQGYGPVRDELYQAVPMDRVPEDARHVGAQLVSRDPEGRERPLRVHEVHDDEIVLDLNHPLAGQSLHFDVKVVSID